jgi:alcohol dehydrogenase class IV
MGAMAHKGGGDDDANSSRGIINGAAFLVVIDFAPEPLKKKTAPLAAASGAGTETAIDANDTYVSLIEKDPVSSANARAKLGLTANHEIAKQLAS